MNSSPHLVSRTRCLALAALVTSTWSSPAPAAPGQDLYVDVALGNSPFAVTTSDSYQSIRVGKTGVGAVTQSTSALTLSGNLMLGEDANSSGTYNLSGGTISSGEAAGIGVGGTGVFNQSGGACSFSVGLYLGNEVGSSGTYNLDGGTLTTDRVLDGPGTCIFNF